MKRNVSVVGIVLISIMLFAGCSGSSGTEENVEPKSITITNIDGLIGEVSVWVYKEGAPRTRVVARGDGVIQNGSVTVQLKETDDSSSITGNDWTGNGQYYIVVGKKDIGPDFTTAGKVDINGAETTIGAAGLESFDEGGEGLGAGEGPFIPGGDFKTAIPASLLFGSFEGEKTIDELLQGLVEEDASFSVSLSYELFKILGGAIYLGPGQSDEVTGSTKVTADTPLYIVIPESGFDPEDDEDTPFIPGGAFEAPVPAGLFFGSFEGEKTIDELLQRLAEEDAPVSISLSYELFKTLGGAIYLGPGQTGEVTGSTGIRETDLLYFGIGDFTEAVVPAGLLFGSFEGEKTIDELLQGLVEEDAPVGIPLTYDWFKTIAGPIYLGPGQTEEISGSTKVTADTILYIPIVTEVVVGEGGGDAPVFSRSLRLPSLR
ncbi:MAG: hypothetical protein LBU21_03240 [Treponema sp.]|jgi:hypothetical protein|nr:hypothetical protein [Treponema sp.]